MKPAPERKWAGKDFPAPLLTSVKGGKLAWYISFTKTVQQLYNRC